MIAKNCKINHRWSAKPLCSSPNPLAASNKAKRTSVEQESCPNSQSYSDTKAASVALAKGFLLNVKCEESATEESSQKGTIYCMKLMRTPATTYYSGQCFWR